MNRQATNHRFEAIWNRTCAQGQAAADGAQIVNSDKSEGNGIGHALFERYAESDRYYHTIEHIDYCLEMFDQVKDQCTNPDAVELAIWFHDAIYEFPVDNNERLSAEYFLEVSDGKLPENLRKVVFDQVIVTDHRSPPADHDQKLLIDIDLSSFGRPWERFLTDGVNVRLEMDYLDDSEFYPRQITFMRQLLNRAHFYATEWFQQNYEQTARENLKRYLSSLSDQGYVAG